MRVVHVTTTLPLPWLRASNPLGYLAALGVLEIAHRYAPDVRLSWAGKLVPHAALNGPDADQLVDWVLDDAREVAASPVLAWPRTSPVPDLKVGPDQLSQWAQCVAGEDAWVSDLWSGLLAEHGYDNGGMSKPTHLHFTAGQQKFLVMVRQLAEGLNPGRVREAVLGPWRYDSTLPTLSWDNKGERIYALRGKNPSGDKRTGVPAADWLAFRGLAFYPTSAHEGRLRTTACNPEWKASAFRWPVWTVPIGRDVARGLVADPSLVGLRDRRPRALGISGVDLHARGVLRVHQARIHRTDQGGYGSFGPPEVLAEAASS